MSPEYQARHQEMMGDIDRCLHLELPEGEKAETCFWIATHHWEKLKEAMQHRPFRHEAEEIDFFRNVKPAFTSWMDYFVLLSEALMFVPRDRCAEILFWEGECDRFGRFCSKHAAFIDYLESHRTDLDEEYFLRRGAADLVEVPGAPLYYLEREFCSSRDGLVKTYLAQKRFYEFSKKRLEILKHQLS